MIVAVDHFAGLGWGVACHRLGIREYGVELAKSAIRMRRANGMRTIYRDVWSGLFDPSLVPEHDLYIASPPCQTFSMAGKGEGRKALEDVLGLIDDLAYVSGYRLERLTRDLDPRTALVLTPLAHIWQHRPRLVALEQVPEVLPVWHAYAAVLRSIGYSVWAGIMRAEQYGVPQTRKRAILMARLDGKVEPPVPTHSRYYSTDPARLDPGVEKWVSMAEALGFGLESRPSPTVTGGGTETGGAEPIAKYARYTERDDWIARDNSSCGGDGVRSVDVPSRTITSKADRISIERPVLLRSQYGAGGDPDARGERLVDEPASTITSKSGSMKWLGPPTWPAERPAPTIVTSRRAAGGMLVGRQLGDGSRKDVGGHSGEGGLKPGQLPGVRVTHEEAAALQSFPPGMAWPGNKGERFLAIGNAVPPLMAEAILSALLAPPAERDAWDLAFAEIAG